MALSFEVFDPMEMNILMPVVATTTTSAIPEQQTADDIPMIPPEQPLKLQPLQEPQILTPQLDRQHRIMTNASSFMKRRVAKPVTNLLTKAGKGAPVLSPVTGTLKDAITRAASLDQLQEDPILVAEKNEVTLPPVQ